MLSVYGTTIPGERDKEQTTILRTKLILLYLAGSAVMYPLILPRRLSPLSSRPPPDMSKAPTIPDYAFVSCLSVCLPVYLLSLYDWSDGTPHTGILLGSATAVGQFKRFPRTVVVQRPGADRFGRHGFAPEDGPRRGRAATNGQ